MASYHFSAKVFKRSHGHSAVAAAAYRAGEKLRDVRLEKNQDFSRRKGVGHTEILLPEGAPDWMEDRQALWNNAEAMENRKDAQVAREITMALPHELNEEERLELVRGFVQEQFVARGMAADLAIHHPVPEKGDNAHNHHAHVLLSMRQVTPVGFLPVKTREWNSNTLLDDWRRLWCERQNAFLERGGHKARVDHRTLVAQRAEALERNDQVRAILLDRQPEIHVGPRAQAAGRRGHRPRSKDRVAGPWRQRKDRKQSLRPGEKVITRTRGYFEPDERDGWLEHQFGERHTQIREEYRDSGRRIVRYTTIDHGSRFEANLRRIDQNLARARKKVDKLAAQFARFRFKRRGLDNYEFEVMRLEEQAMRERAWEKYRSSEELWRNFFTAKRRHVKKRQGQLDAIIPRVGELLRALLGGREPQLRRAQGLRQGPRPLFGRKRTDGHARRLRLGGGSGPGGSPIS